MTALMTALITLTLGVGNGLWLDAYELKQPVTVAETGEYTPWVWLPAGESGEISVGDTTLKFSAKKAPKDQPYAWVKGEALTLEAGEQTIKEEGAILSVYLAADAKADPATLQAFHRVQPGPEAVHDRRAHTARHTNTVFTMPHYESKAAWEDFATGLRRRILVATGLYPMPERTPLNAKVFDKIEHEDYTVEKAYFEAFPGFYVTGNLYRPVGKAGPHPGVIAPHGHWADGRLEDGERGSVPARGITLARMGMVVFMYDMIGYNDSMQFEHRWGGNAEKLYGIHPFSMQLWSAIRALDFLETLPEVDKDRLACTGASGGGTQTFAVSAVDERVKVAAPVNMISSTMQGGCLCENAPIIRFENSNMEIGALMAPRPLLMVSATGDWTRETPRVEYPAIRSIYELYGAEKNIESVQMDAPHNYNKDSREAMYRFFGKHLLGGDWSEYTEPDYALESIEALRVFPDNTLPEGSKTADEIIAGRIAEREATAKANPATDDELRAVLADALGVGVPGVNDLRSERTGISELGDLRVEHWIIGRATVGDAVPAILYRATDWDAQDAVILVAEEGKSAFVTDKGPDDRVNKYIADGKAVLCIDLFLSGEHHATGKKTHRYKEGGFMDTFQPTDFANRVQDILTAASFLKARRDMTGHISLDGYDTRAVEATFAAAVDSSLHLNAQVSADEMAGLDWEDDYYSPSLASLGTFDKVIALAR